MLVSEICTILRKQKIRKLDARVGKLTDTKADWREERKYIVFFFKLIARTFSTVKYKRTGCFSKAEHHRVVRGSRDILYS